MVVPSTCAICTSSLCFVSFLRLHRLWLLHRFWAVLWSESGPVCGLAGRVASAKIWAVIRKEFVPAKRLDELRGQSLSCCRRAIPTASNQWRRLWRTRRALEPSRSNKSRRSCPTDMQRWPTGITSRAKWSSRSSKLPRCLSVPRIARRLFRTKMLLQD